MDKLKENLLKMGMFPCADCSYGCEPPRREALCPKDVDQILALFKRGKPPLVSRAMEGVSKNTANELIQFQRESDIKYYGGEK